MNPSNDSFQNKAISERFCSFFFYDRKFMSSIKIAQYTIEKLLSGESHVDNL